MSAEKYFTCTPKIEFCPELAKDDYIKAQIKHALYSGQFGGYEITKDGMAEILPGLRVGIETAAEWTLEAIDAFESEGFELEVKLK